MTDDKNKQVAVIEQITSVVGIVPKFIVAGNIKIGGKGETKTSEKGNDFQLPIKFDNFKITTTERGPDGNLIENVELTETIKSDGGMVNSAGGLVRIPVMFMFDDTSLNMPVRRVCYVGGKLACQGNGEEAYSMMDNFSKPQKCPCHKAGLGYSKNDKCKLHAKLTFIIEASPLFGQVFKFTTTGENSIKGILATIELIKKLTKGRIAGLPLMLTFNKLSTQTPTGINTTIPVVGLCFRGDMFRMRQQAIELFEKDAEFANDMKQIEESARQAGEGSFFDEDDKEADMVSEYFPDKDAGSGEIIDVESSEVVEKLEPVVKKSELTAGQKYESGIEEGGEEAHQEETGDIQSDLIIDEKEKAKIEIFERLQGQSDPVKAIALAKRNDVKYLIKYFKRYNVAPEMSDKIKKPSLITAFENFTNTESWRKAVTDYTSGKFVETNTTEKVSLDEQKPGQEAKNPESEAVKDVNTDPLMIAISKTDDRVEIIRLTAERFPDIPFNRTLDSQFLVIQAKRLLENEGKEKPNTSVKKSEIAQGGETKTETEPDKEPGELDEKAEDVQKDPRYFALEGEFQVERLTITEIIKLKKQISDLDDKEKWFDLVGEFTDLKGEYVVSAKFLTQKQGDFLKVLLQMMINGVPF